jgi:uncharacterized lipoprotein
VKKFWFAVIASSVLSSCSGRYFSNGENFYLQSHNGPKLIVPSSLTSAHLSNFYDLPPQNQDPRVSIEPPGEEIITS